MKVRICGQWRDRRAEVNQRVVCGLSGEAVAQVGREYEHKKKILLIGVLPLLQPAHRIKGFIVLMSKLGLLILVKPTGLQKQAALFNLIASLLGKPSIPTAKSAKRKGKPKPQMD